MKEISLKSTVLFLIICLNWLGLSMIGQTWAYFNDTENSVGNVYSAGILDFSLVNTDIEEFIGVELGEDIKFLSIAVKTTDSFDIQYRARAEKMSGSNDDFCDALEMEVSHSQISHDDSLLSFDTATTTAFGTWAFEIELPFTATHIPHGVECNVDLVFEGWQTDVEDYSDGGFSDEERIHLRLTSRMVVLNEFLPNPEGIDYGFDFGTDSDLMPRGEWVEIYNNSDSAFDLDGWYVWDASESEVNKIYITDSNTYSTSTIVDSKSWLVVYMNKAVLDNTGDTVKLYDSGDILVDSYSYVGHNYCEFEPTPGDQNGFFSSGETCAIVPPNKSYARIPDGIGTWVDPIPTPGRMNILEDENTVLINPTPVNSIIEEIIEVEEIIEEVIEEEVVEIQVDWQDDIINEIIDNVVEEVIELIEEAIDLGGIIEEPVAEEPIDEPVDELIDEPIVEESVAKEPVIDESITEEPVIEEIIKQEVVEEPIDEPADEVVDEPVVEETVVEPVVEEQVIEEIIEEEPIIIDEETLDETNDETNEDE